MVYGGSYQVYGAGVCPNCHAAHVPTFQIQESQQSRFRLMQFMAEMSTILTAVPSIGPTRPPVVHAGAGQRFMLGILISGVTTLVAASGNSHTRRDFVRVAGMKDYMICPPRKALQGPNTSAAGRQIPIGQYMATQRAGASPPGDCAAPRLIQQALSMPALAANLQRWEMSEVFYQPNTERRTKSDPYWVHGLSAHHCATCDNLIPLLMCPVP